MSTPYDFSDQRGKCRCNMVYMSIIITGVLAECFGKTLTQSNPAQCNTSTVPPGDPL